MRRKRWKRHQQHQFQPDPRAADAAGALQSLATGAANRSFLVRSTLQRRVSAGLPAGVPRSQHRAGELLLRWRVCASCGFHAERAGAAGIAGCLARAARGSRRHCVTEPPQRLAVVPCAASGREVLGERASQGARRHAHGSRHHRDDRATRSRHAKPGRTHTDTCRALDSSD